MKLGLEVQSLGQEFIPKNNNDNDGDVDDGYL